MLQPYDTILTEAQDEIIIQRSRFIGYACPVESEEKVQEIIAAIRKKYWDATHHVWAFSVGVSNPIQRCSDDGEPQGTAGMPVLDVIRSERLTNILVVVIRYFGGIKLGTGGLVRAYTQGAKAALAAGKIIKKAPHYLYSINTNYSLIGRFQKEFEQRQFRIKDIIFEDTVTFQVLVPIEQGQELEKLTIELSSGQNSAQKGEELYVDIPRES